MARPPIDVLAKLAHVAIIAGSCLAVSPDGCTAYVANSAPAMIIPIDLATSPPAVGAGFPFGVVPAAVGSQQGPDPAPGAGKAPVARWALPRSRVKDLTAREYEVFVLLGEGLDNRMITQALGLSERTVKFHVTSILRKLGLQSRLQAGLTAAEHALEQGYPKVQWRQLSVNADTKD